MAMENSHVLVNGNGPTENGQSIRSNSSYQPGTNLNFLKREYYKLEAIETLACVG